MLSSEALKAARTSLARTSTVVTHRDGHRTVERDGATVSTLPPPDVLPPALQQPERKRLCIEPPTQPTWALPPLSAALPLPTNDSLRVVTWNVWFAPVDADARMAALFQEALGTAPDVLCLQEVVPELSKSLRASRGLRDAFAISQNDVGAYGCMLLVRHELQPTFQEVRFPSQMGRSLLIAECSAPTAGRIAVATAHLESLGNAPTRAKQLKAARAALAGYEKAVLCGDFNFDSTQNFGDWRTVPPRPPRPMREEEEDDDDEPYAGPVRVEPELENAVLGRVLGEGYVDAWPALRPEEPGHTFDGEANPHVADPEERMRYDRVMVRGVAPVSIKMLGVGAEPPSDHYGLCAEVR